MNTKNEFSDLKIPLNGKSLKIKKNSNKKKN